MKSAYEIAMERMKAAGSNMKSLTPAQREKIAEIEKVYDAKLAEARLKREGEIAALRASGQYQEAAALNDALSKELADIKAQRDAEKDKIWQEKG